MSHFPLCHALAYLDGGTGSMLLQAILAGTLSAAYIVKRRWADLRGFIGGLARRQNRTR